MDPLSRALIDTHLRGALLATLKLAAPWSIDFGESIGIPVHYVIKGEAWLHVEGYSQCRLVEGDLVMLPRWHRHWMSAMQQLDSATPISELVRQSGRKVWSQGQWLEEPLALEVTGSGARCELFSMVVEPDRSVTSPILSALPAVIRVDEEDVAMRVWLKPVLAFMAAESASQQPGYAIVQSRLAELLFVQIIRSQLLSRQSDVGPDVRILLDAAVSKSVQALKADVSRRWTVADMADVAGVSRSAFAARFSGVVGMSPFAFLRELRLDGAAQRLKQGVLVKAVAIETGYSTDFSFANAFKRRFKVTPGQYRREARRRS